MMSHSNIVSDLALCVPTSSKNNYSDTEISMAISTGSNYSSSMRTHTEILFDLFPSIFISYLEVDTFCNLLKTDICDWQHLLSKRIVFDYMWFLSQRSQDKIAEFCGLPNILRDEESSDSDDSFEGDDIFYDDDDEQNSAIVQITMSKEQTIDSHFIFTQFRNIDIVYATMLDNHSEVGLSSNLCKKVAIESDPCTNIRACNQAKVSEYDRYDDLCYDLQSRDDFTDRDLSRLEDVLLTDMLSMCTDKWYFVEWELSAYTYVNEYDECFECKEMKQMIIAHIDSDKYNKLNPIQSNVKSELFSVWAVEWQQNERTN